MPPTNYQQFFGNFTPVERDAASVQKFGKTYSALTEPQKHTILKYLTRGKGLSK